MEKGLIVISRHYSASYLMSFFLFKRKLNSPERCHNRLWEELLPIRHSSSFLSEYFWLIINWLCRAKRPLVLPNRICNCCILCAFYRFSDFSLDSSVDLKTNKLTAVTFCIKIFNHYGILRISFIEGIPQAYISR